MTRPPRKPAPAQRPAQRSAVPAPRPAAPPPPTATPVPRGSYLAALAVAALCVVVSVTFRSGDADVWQHLVVGRAIWTTHSIPRVNLWTWPTYGTPQVLPSWGFAALLWPFWAAGGWSGIVAWRWLSTLLTFSLLLLAARRMGARGLSALLVMVLCALVYRQRVQPRPETLAGVLLAFEIWLLESRRAARASGGADPSLWLIAVAWVWANVHLSYFVGLIVIGFYALAELAPGARAAGASNDRRLWWIGLAALAVSFVNPFGWRALWEPFAFLVSGRQEMMYQGIGELRPVAWGLNRWNGLPLLLVAWPLLALWGWRRMGADWAEILMLLCFGVIGLRSQRFLGFFAVAAAPYLARDLESWLATSRFARALGARRIPAWFSPPTRRATLTALACVALALPEWLLSPFERGFAYNQSIMPSAGCDFVAAHDVRGRGYNPFHFGGYLLWRFWPDRGRLPFHDIHQTGTVADRDLAARAFNDPAAYHELMAKYPFDWALVDRETQTQFALLDFFDQDSSWAAVFADDVAALYVRRAGPMRALADSFAYRVWPAGFGHIGAVFRRYRADTAYAAAVRAELSRQIAASPENAVARNFRANVLLIDGNAAAAEPDLRAALVVAPWLPRAHFRLGLLALERGRRDETAREFALELRAQGAGEGIEVAAGAAWQRAGDAGRAREWYRRAIRRGHDAAAARDSLAALDRMR